jgi:dephospho-CoA kinase
MESGKDTAANAFEDATRLAFADPLKHACVHLFDLSMEQVYDRVKKMEIDPRWGKTSRKILQLVGTDVIRQVFGEDHFVRLMKFRIDRAIREGAKLIIITDCRFPNEAKFIRDIGGTVIGIKREGGIIDEHASERPLPRHLLDFTVHNNGTIEELHEKVKDIVNVKTSGISSRLRKRVRYHK